MNHAEYDYVIVGAGTAGCVLAARLSASGTHRVALLEAGGKDDNPAIFDRDMNAMFSLWDPHGAENWGYVTTPQDAIDGRVIDVARGKVLGGCSAINAMIHVRGHERNYDDWGKAAEGWGYDDLLPYLQRSERYHGKHDKAGRGTEGDVDVIDYHQPAKVTEAFVTAVAAKTGGTPDSDLNGPDQEAGPGFYQSTRTENRVRVTAATAFVHPNQDRENLDVLTHHRALHLTFEGDTCTGVACETPDGEAHVSAAAEVIVTAGAYETPKLLMLSGIGPAAHLTEHGIPVRRDVPAVGENLKDHMLLGVAYESPVPLEAPEMLAEGGAFLRSNDDVAIPDLQYFFGPVQFVPPRYMSDEPGFTFAPILAQPFSTGTVRLASADPHDNAIVDPHYLEDERDVELFAYGIALARELVQHPAFDPFRGKELAPGADVTDAEGIRAYIREAAGTVWHPACTCRMGAADDPSTVVDGRLCVHGLRGLRIADASVMPTLVNANPHASILAIAEKAADMIADDATKEASHHAAS